MRSKRSIRSIIYNLLFTLLAVLAAYLSIQFLVRSTSITNLLVYGYFNIQDQANITVNIPSTVPDGIPERIKDLKELNEKYIADTMIEDTLAEDTVNGTI
jgi:hypothetical protein